MPITSLRIPIEVVEFVISLLDEDDPYYFDTLKSLSLVSSQLLPAVRCQLFQKHVFRFQTRSGGRQMLPDTNAEEFSTFLRSHPNVASSVRELEVIGVKKIKGRRIEAEVDRFWELMKIISPNSITSLRIRFERETTSESLGFVARALLLPERFTSLQRLQIERVAGLDVAPIAFLSKLEDLELQRVSVKAIVRGPPSESPPKLKRLVVKEASVITTGWPRVEIQVVELFSSRLQFDLGWLEELEVSVSRNTWHLLQELSAVRTERLSTVSCDFRDTSHGIFKWGTLDSLGSVHTVRHILLWPTNRRPHDFYILKYRCDGVLPKSIKRLSILLAWPIQSQSVLDERFDDVLALLDAELRDAFENTWPYTALRQIDFRLLVRKSDLKLDLASLRFNPTYLRSAIDRGIHISIQPNEIASNSFEWP